MAFSGAHILWITVWVSGVAAIIYFTKIEWLSVPWLPLSVIGTAVAFYIGFKNNQAYDRLWEARKIWGGIVNSSRAWGSAVKSFVSNQFVAEALSEEDLHRHQKKLIRRHIGYLYALRSQLLIPTSWEHISQNNHISKTTKKRMKVFGIGLVDDDVTQKNLLKYLEGKEYEEYIQFANTATQLLDKQSQELQKLRAENLIDDFRHMELQALINEFYDHQGKCERIKKFPLPRQYGSMSFIFVGIFIFLLPFGMISEFQKFGDWGIWASIPFTVLVCWVYLMMELVGDYSENPFEGLGNDIPMLSLTRVIEIDLLQMLRESDIPESIKPQNGVLM